MLMQVLIGLHNNCAIVEARHKRKCQASGSRLVGRNFVRIWRKYCADACASNTSISNLLLLDKFRQINPTIISMAGGVTKYRHLSRTSSHRQALLRNLVSSLFKHETISTTWHKAKEAQRLAEKLITLGKKNTEASKRSALSIFYVCATSHPHSTPPETHEYKHPASKAPKTDTRTRNPTC